MKKGPLGDKTSDYQQESMLRAMENAYRLLNSPERKAFDLTLEPKESYEKYNTGRFGLGCLLRGDSSNPGAVYRGHDRIRAVPALGHARKRPHNGRTNETRN